MELSTIADYILDAGLIGVLILGIWAFMTGKLWPKEMVDKTISAQQESSEKTAEILSQVICEKMLMVWPMAWRGASPRAI